MAFGWCGTYLFFYIFEPMNNSNLDTTLGKFRVVAILEGISFLILLGIAMPLKYIYGMPIAVRIAGSIHGMMFLTFLYYLAKVRKEYNWENKMALRALLASVLPFGPFVLERKLRG